VKYEIPTITIPSNAPTAVFIAHQRGLHTDSIACPRPTAKFSLHTQSWKSKFLKIINRLICRFFVYRYMNSICASLNNNRKLFTYELLNVDSGSCRYVLQEILTPSLIHLMTFDFGKAILYDMRRLQGKWKYGRGILWCTYQGNCLEGLRKMTINLSLDSRFVTLHLETVTSKIRGRAVKTQTHSPALFNFFPNNVASFSVLTNFSDHRFDKLFFFCFGCCN